MLVPFGNQFGAIDSRRMETVWSNVAHPSIGFIPFDKTV